jgi:hypothetical protein
VVVHIFLVMDGEWVLLVMIILALIAFVPRPYVH